MSETNVPAEYTAELSDDYDCRINNKLELTRCLLGSIREHYRLSPEQGLQESRRLQMYGALTDISFTSSGADHASVVVTEVVDHEVPIQLTDAKVYILNPPGSENPWQVGTYGLNGVLQSQSPAANHEGHAWACELHVALFDFLDAIQGENPPQTEHVT